MAIGTESEQLNVNEPNDIVFEGLIDHDGAYINDATMTFTVLDSSGGVIAENQPMTYIAASDGNYRGQLAYTAKLVAGRQYTIIYQSTGKVYRRITKFAQYRGAT
jgi:hypothetical protein